MGRNSASRYIVGIDLGTTNSVVAYVDADDAAGAVRDLQIPQLTAPGAVEGRPVLPSFLYLAAENEFPVEALALPWGGGRAIAGVFAQKRGAEVPHRLVSSAKSWLSHQEADRTAAILPWGSGDDVEKLSPVEASTHYLSHLRSAWNAAMAKAPLEEQEVLLTVPASFDAVARDLTQRAAQAAGLERVTLLEEPQAAFYAWIQHCGDEWRTAVKVGDVVLVCDIGGGTTDFTLIAVGEREGQLTLERIAVGDHILLGGDNMDLALAFQVRERLAAAGTTLDAWQFRALTLSCREAKEHLLASDAKDTKRPVSILGRGRKLVGGTVRTDVDRADVDSALLAGFMPPCSAGDQPQAQKRTGLQEIGLPYASDPAITRHLATFLARHRSAVGAATGNPAARPTALLFNGGVMRSPALRRRLVEVINSWDPSSVASARILAGADPEHAVARGAVYYGLARRGRGVRIRGGTARAYYVGIEAAMPAVPGMRPPIRALCVVPRGLEEGSDVEMPPQEFGLAVGEPAEFRFLASATRHDDAVGTIVDTWGDEIQELAPLATTMEWKGQEGATVPVSLQARVNEVGVLELWCVSRDGSHRWKLEFNVRAEA
jgi:molecular chaperone DnaK (HSP70)